MSYQVSKEGAGGAVSPRDFVTLRHHKICPDGIHILASESVKHPAKPKQPKITRYELALMKILEKFTYVLFLIERSTERWDLS